MVVPDSNEGPPPGSSPQRPPPTSETPPSASRNQQPGIAIDASQHRAPAPSELPLDSTEPPQSGTGDHQNTSSGSSEPPQAGRSTSTADGAAQARPASDGGERETPRRWQSNVRTWLPPHLHPSPTAGTPQDPVAITAQGVISAVLGRGMFTNMMPPGSRTQAVYLISIHDEEPHGKASNAALRRLRTIPLSEIPVDERECTICYEPLEEVPEEALQQQADLAAADAAAENTRSETGAAAPEQEEEEELPSAKDGHAPLQLPCKHSFGASCLRTWLQNSSTCPLCRTSVEPNPTGPRRHIVQRQEDLDRLWSTIMRPYADYSQRPAPQNGEGSVNSDESTAQASGGAAPAGNGATGNGAAPPEDSNDGTSAPGATPHPRMAYPIDFGEIVNALNTHAEQHRQQREQQQQQQQQQRQQQEQQPDGSSASEGRDTDMQMSGDPAGEQEPQPGQNQSGEREHSADQPGGNQPDQPGHSHMHFHFSLDEALRENWPHNTDVAPQEFIFDIRIMPQPGTVDASGDADGPTPGAPDGVDLASLRARQREEMERAVRAAAERFGTADPSGDAEEEPRRRRSSRRMSHPMAIFNPTQIRFDDSGPEDPPLRQEDRPSPRQRQRTGTERSAQAPQAGEWPISATSQPPQRPASPTDFFFPPPTEAERNAPRSTSTLPFVRGPGRATYRGFLAELSQANRERRRERTSREQGRPSGQDLGDDAFIDEGLFQAFRRHFGAPDEQQDVLAEHLNARLPPPESQNDSMLVDSDISRSATPSADAPVIEQSEDADMSRSGPTRRSGRRRHPYPRS